MGSLHNASTGRNMIKSNPIFQKQLLPLSTVRLPLTGAARTRLCIRSENNDLKVSVETTKLPPTEKNKTVSRRRFKSKDETTAGGSGRRLRRKTKTTAGGRLERKTKTVAASSGKRLKRRDLKPEEHPKWCSDAPKLVDTIELLSITFGHLDTIFCQKRLVHGYL